MDIPDSQSWIPDISGIVYVLKCPSYSPSTLWLGDLGGIDKCSDGRGCSPRDDKLPEVIMTLTLGIRALGFELDFPSLYMCSCVHVCSMCMCVQILNHITSPNISCSSMERRQH